MFRQLCHLPLLLLLLCAPNGLRARQFPASVAHNGVASDHWQAYAPGQLLQKLDSLTDAAVAGEPLKVTTNTTASTARSPARPAHRKSDMDDHDDDAEADENDEVNAQATSSTHGPDNGNSYERTYEQFVRQYFDRADEDQSLDSISAHSASVESHELDTDDGSALHEDIDEDYDYEPAAKASNVKAKQSKRTKPGGKSRTRCKHVRRNKEQCKICRDARNNEISETCSYSHEATPQQFAYGAARQYKRYKPDPDVDEDEDEDDGNENDADKDEPQSAETTHKHTQNSNDNAKSKTKTGKRVRPDTHANDTKLPHGASNSFCVRRLQAKKVCYECKDSNTGAPLTRCYASKHKPKARKTQQRRHNAEQRIYKRTVSYATYTQASTNDSEPAMTTTTAPHTPATTKNVITSQKRSAPSSGHTRSARPADDQSMQTFQNGSLALLSAPTTATKTSVVSLVNTATTATTTTTMKVPTLSPTNVQRGDHNAGGRSRTLLKVVRRKRLN